MLLRSFGLCEAASGFGEAVPGLSGGDSDASCAFPAGELLRLLCEPGVTVSKALPNGDDPTVLFGSVYGANLCPPLLSWWCSGELGFI